MADRLDPLRIRDGLDTLLTAVERLPELESELDRATREFFGGRDPRENGADGAELAALRFVEWYLCERESEVLGAPPLDVAQTRLGIPTDVPTGSVVGVFLVQNGGDDPVVRDVIDKAVYSLRAVPEPLEVGDALIGRLYPAAGGDEMVPSAAVSIVSASPRFAIAFQRDVEALDLDRRLTQAELEHLLFRDATPAAQPAGPPLERVEAELATLLEAGGSSLSAPRVTDAMREATRPAAIIDDLLDELAFETEVDLDAMRRCLVDLAGAVESSGESSPPEPAPPRPSVSQTPAEPQPPLSFEEREGEGLGESIARRIEEGLARDESVESMFAQVEGMLGESIEDDGDERLVGLDVGDLEPLVREFSWELGIEDADQARIEAFVAAQNGAPVPRSSLETVEADDVLRFLLHAWLDRPEAARVAEVRSRFELIERFYAWAAETQGIDRRSELESVREAFVDELDRLERAGKSLRRSDRVAAGTASLFVVVEVDAENAWLRFLDGDRGAQDLRVSLVGEPSERDALRAEDLILGSWDGESGCLDGMVSVIPLTLQRLLG